MKKIFILKGVSNTGKTTKINLIAEWIINTYAIPNTIGLDSTNYEINTWGVLTIGNLKIGINSAGDNETEILKVDQLVNQFPDVDIIICACRTKGITYQHLYKNYIRRNGWLDTYIHVEEYQSSNLASQTARDTRILNELRTWLIGLPK